MMPSRTMLVPGGTAQARVRLAAGYPQELVAFVRDGDLDECRAYVAWQLAEMAVGLTAADRIALVILCARLLVAEGRGSTRLGISDQDSGVLLRAAELVGRPRGNTPLVLDEGHLYTRRSYACETRVAAAVAARLTGPGMFSRDVIEKALRDIAGASVPPPSAEQMAAVVQALGRPIGIISGGPGTGKTTTALALVRCLSRLGIPAARIALCAPTGKAASRMEDDLRRRLAGLVDPNPADAALVRDCPKAQTLHRLLGITLRSDVGHSIDEPLPFRAVIVDESSMVDLVLMDRLLAAVPLTVPLVLLGDADQLPSVAAGSAFRDLGAHAARLEHGFRTGGSGAAGQALSSLAAAVGSGQAAAVAALCSLRGEPAQLRHAGVERVPGERRSALLREYHRARFAAAEVLALARHVYTLRETGFDAEDSGRLDTLAAHVAASRILTVTRERTTGSVHTNALLHDLAGGGPGFLPGEPVLMMRNDYQRELWNGDQGVAVLARKPGRDPTLVIGFRTRTGWQAVDPEALRGALDFAYALTVHKSQGSELDEVLLLLPDFACPIFTRELLYTAVSRARRSVVFCGAADMLDLAIATKENRNSGVADRLAGLVTPLT